MADPTERQHTTAEGRRDLGRRLARLQADALDFTSPRVEGFRAQGQHHGEGRVRPHTRHYSTPSRFTAR